MAILVTIDHRAWKKSRSIDRLARQAALAALKTAGSDPSRCDLAISFASDATLARLNRQWRATNGPTNVLSFPARPVHGGRFLGDVILAGGVVGREARRQGKRLPDHAAHLIVHGVLHLLGHDHHKTSAARKMEHIEIRALRSLGIGNPYLCN
jgi:probable rRNA maturation factor